MLAIARDRLCAQTPTLSGAACRYVSPAISYRQRNCKGSTSRCFIRCCIILDDPQAAVAEAARVLEPGGRLLIADFAPHELEFLRADYAHRRLGFSDREVEGWFEAAGLKSQASETIAPKHQSGGKLTVKIWLAKSTEARAEGGRMSLKDLATNANPLKVSFEFSPPKTPEAEDQLWRCIRRLEPLKPAFVSVTYGAGGSTRERTHATVKRIVEETT